MSVLVSTNLGVNSSTLIVRLLGTAVLGSLLAGCAEVKPWERGNLAKPHMSLQPFPVQAAFREHIYGSRESASGGSASAGGGGCGCY
jgi:hypothetical protein